MNGCSEVIKKLYDMQLACAVYGDDEAIQTINDVIALLEEQEMRELSESCENCNAYDNEKHYCPKFCRVIRETLDEMKPKWIPVTDILPSAGEEYWTLRHFERLPIVQILKYGIPDGFDSEYFYAHDDEWGEDTVYGGVTHWLPKSALPELPKEEAKDFPPYLDYPIKPKEEEDVS